ncbi:hypothetical protein E7T06_02190 [Deinococcus sp. Arct2-2]|uniref:hypothetical protein n=1 Tax=Deinococcus sp. Arct2-2 TaxID=2568653 RepID=UPI0010A40192|nr:hypothetical protein [Deinococcus sp. Arct2-2]THF71449.1 hypothetical protein E7T06_02190 [Deinococcus sp. Arct2-2]
MSLPAALSPTRPAPEVWVAEERGVFLPTSGHISFVGLHGQALEKPGAGKPVKNDNGQRLPYIESYGPHGVQVRLTDWVGRLTFVTESDAGRVQHPVLVYPAKLHEQPQQAFAALGRMVDALPELGQILNFPQALLSASDELAAHRGSGPAAPHLLELAGQAWHLWQLARRRPQLVQGHGQRVLDDGRVPDRVDWDLTFEHWGRGGFPGHVARDLAPPLPPAATSALLALWDALIAAAQRLPHSAERTPLLTRFAWAKAALPGGGAAPSAGRSAPHPNRAGRGTASTAAPTTPLGQPADPLARQATLLTEQVRQWSQQATGVPEGHTRMAELYEIWALARLTQALGASSGEFQRDSSGLFTGTFRGNGVTVTLNPQLSFRGIGLGLQLLRPDLLAVFDDGRALVADVKYRPLDRLMAQQLRDINDQLLRYMGLSHAATGLILWPGRAEAARPASRPSLSGSGVGGFSALRNSAEWTAEPQPEPPPYSPEQAIQVNLLPGERARMARVRLHPNDPHGALPSHLHTLGFPEVGA